jgi:hypothetical protein
MWERQLSWPSMRLGWALAMALKTADAACLGGFTCRRNPGDISLTQEDFS